MLRRNLPGSIMAAMKPMVYIRKMVFHLSQQAFASAIGVSQALVSRWEREMLEPGRDEMIKIRNLAADRGVKWDDRWFFEEHVDAVDVTNDDEEAD